MRPRRNLGRKYDQWFLHRSIYHLLSRPLGQEVSVAEVVDFDVLDVVSVGNVHLAIDRVGRVR